MNIKSINRCKWIVLLLCLCHLSTQAQSSKDKRAQQLFEEEKIEEAIELWEQSKEEYLSQNNNEEAFRVLMTLGKTVMHQFKVEEAQAYYEQARDLAQEKKLIMEYGQALNSLTTIYQFNGDQEKAFETCHEILNTPGLNSRFISDAYTTLANIYETRLDYEKAESYILKAIEIDSINQDSSSLPFNYASYARYQSRQAKNDIALNYLLKSIDYLRGDIDKFKYATIYNEISRVFLSLNNNYKSQEYALKSIEICNALNLKTTKIDALISLALVEERAENYNKALKYYFEAEEISQSKKRVNSTSLIHLGIANCYLELGDIKTSQARLEKASQLLEGSTNDSQWLKHDFIKSRLMLLQNKSEALAFTMGTYNKAKQNNDIYSRKALAKMLSNYYLGKKNYARAVQYLEKYSTLKDSIYLISQSFFTQELEAKYIRQEQDTKIELLAAENALKSIKLRQQSLVIWGSGLALLIFAALMLGILHYYRKHKKQKELAEKSLHEKNVLLREIHHRVKNNLQVISSLLALQSKYIQDDTAINALQQGQDRVQSMALIHEDLYRSENLMGVDTEIYFSQLIDNLFESYNIHEEDIQLNMEVETLSLDVETMIPLGLVLNELVSNSLKHAFADHSSGAIFVSLKEQNNTLILEVKDNGQKIQSTSEIDGKSFGFELIKAFARKLKAELELYIDNGLGVKMTIKNYQKAA